MGQTVSADGDAAPPPLPATTSVGARMMNVFATPGDVFAEVKVSKPNSANWLLPALLLTLVGWLSAWLIFSQESVRRQLSDLGDKAIQKQVEARKLTREQAEQARAMTERFAGIGVKIGAVIAPVFQGFGAPFWWALILWLVGTKALKGDFTYLCAAEVAGLANMIMILASIVKTLLIVTFGNLYAGASLVLLMPDFDGSDPLQGFLAKLDLLTFWSLIVYAVGLAKLSNHSLGKAAAWVFGLWLGFNGLILGAALGIKRLTGY